MLLSCYTAHPYEETAGIEILSYLLQTIENDIHLKNEKNKKAMGIIAVQKTSTDIHEECYIKLSFYVHRSII